MDAVEGEGRPSGSAQMLGEGQCWPLTTELGGHWSLFKCSRTLYAPRVCYLPGFLHQSLAAFARS